MFWARDTDPTWAHANAGSTIGGRNFVRTESRGRAVAFDVAGFVFAKAAESAIVKRGHTHTQETDDHNHCSAPGFRTFAGIERGEFLCPVCDWTEYLKRSRDSG